MPTDRLVRGPWELGIGWQTRREACGGVRGAGRLPANPQLPRLARQAIGRRILRSSIFKD